jgi:hypothetical protein
MRLARQDTATAIAAPASARSDLSPNTAASEGTIANPPACRRSNLTGTPNAHQKEETDL